MSKIDGKLKVNIGRVQGTLLFNWQALAEVESEFGETPNFFKSEVTAKIAEFGFKATNPELTQDRIMELSPPLVPFISAVQSALNSAYYGTDPEPKKSKKKILVWVVELLRRFLRLSGTE
jgi:hypothetical protein